MIGKTLAHYRILEQIGAGGMGVVYRARDEALRRDVAVKVLPAGLSGDPERLRRFQDEARAAGALNHPNILAIYDFGEHKGSPYEVSELLEGKTLRDQMAGRALPERKAVEYGIQIARGLSAAHEKGIVHRDLKPENIFVTKDGRVKILDFGLAKLTHPDPGAAGSGETVPGVRTEPGLVLGSVGYMAPEQVRGQQVDHRADLFAFGAVLYEMLTGRRAFQRGSAADTMSAILNEEPVDLTAVRAELLPGLDRIVRHCLEKDPLERFQSARDMVFDLESLAGKSGPAVVVPSGLRKLARAVGLSTVGLLVLVLALWMGPGREWLAPGPSSTGIQSLAVLPLKNLSAEPEQEYFADGMTEELTSTLAQISALKVISRTSSMRYKATTKSLPEIGRELGVDAVVEGSVLRSGGRVRVTAQLIRAATDEHLWARSYERELRDVLALQSEVAQAVAHEIQVKLNPWEAARLASSRPVNPEAHEAYLKARYYWNKRTAQAIERAIQYCEEAIAKAPAYALAHAALADCYEVLPSYKDLPPGEAHLKATAAALKALALDSTLAGPHAVLAGEAHSYEWNFAKAEMEFRSAIELNPSYATAHQWYGEFLLSMGRHEEALAEAKRALSLDPLSLIINTLVGVNLLYARDYDGAIEQFRRTLEIDSTFARGYLVMGDAYWLKGRYGEAVAAYERSDILPVVNLDELRQWRASLRKAYRLGGMTGYWRKMLELDLGMAQRSYVAPSRIAFLYGVLGERDQAFHWLERAYNERDPSLVLAWNYPMWDGLRSDPRFQALMKRVGLPG